MKIRFHWHFFSHDPSKPADWRSTVLEIDELMSEIEAKELIAIELGDRTLAQYMNMGRMEWA